MLILFSDLKLILLSSLTDYQSGTLYIAVALLTYRRFPINGTCTGDSPSSNFVFFIFLNVLSRRILFESFIKPLFVLYELLGNPTT